MTPRVWVSDDQVPDAATRWVSAQTAHPASGWWPLLLPRSIDLDHFGTERTESIDAERFLADQWESEEIQFFTDPEAVEDASLLLPYADWPGLAPASAGPDPDTWAASVLTRPELAAGQLSDPFSGLELHPDTPVPNPLAGIHRLGLVETPDSAGAIAASGWEHELGGGPEGTAVLRSWQERFGVRLCALGTDWLAVTVAWPVDAIEHARRVAAEHVAFCPDIVGEVGFEQYAKGLTDATIWRFWWD